MRAFSILVLALLLSSITFAQKRVIKGEVTAFYKYPLQHIVVSAKKAKTSVMTDSTGQFEIVCNEKDIIKIEGRVFSSTTKRVKDIDDKFLLVNLIFRDTERNRKVATGMNYISEENLNYALAHMDAENNDFCNYNNIFTLLKSKFAVVTVMGSPSGGQGVFIRGTKSLTGSNEAIYVLNGMQIEDISFVLPCDLTSVDVQKGGAAAIYGSHGANGAVILETKGN